MIRCSSTGTCLPSLCAVRDGHHHLKSRNASVPVSAGAFSAAFFGKTTGDRPKCVGGLPASVSQCFWAKIIAIRWQSSRLWRVTGNRNFNAACVKIWPSAHLLLDGHREQLRQHHPPRYPARAAIEPAHQLVQPEMTSTARVCQSGHFFTLLGPFRCHDYRYTATRSMRSCINSVYRILARDLINLN